MVNARVEKLVRDAVIWTHAAGYAVLQVETFRS